MIMVVLLREILIGIIKVYQMIPGPWHDMCRHVPSCSNYGIEAIKIHGAFYGSYLTIKRILRCNPFGTSGYDPVPKGKKE